MKNLSLKKILLALTAVAVCVAIFATTTMTALGAPTQSPSDTIYVTPTFKGLNIQDVLEVVGKIFVKEMANKDGSAITVNSDLNVKPKTEMLVTGAQGKAAIKVVAGSKGEWMGLVPGLLYYFAPNDSVYKNLFLWAHNGNVYIGASSSNKNNLIVFGDNDVRGAIKNTEPLVVQGCGITHPCPPAGSTQPVTVDDGLKVTGMIDDAGALSVAGDITSQGSYKGGFSTQNFSTGYNECTIPANSIKKDCKAYCSFDDTPIDCGYILQLPKTQSTPVMGVNVNAIFADILDGTCNAVISNSTATSQKVGIRAVCINE